MLRRKSVNSVIPVPDNFTCREFEDVQLVDEIVPLYDARGNKVDEMKKSIVVRKPIASEVLEHRGEKCELFSIENQINAGVSLRDFSGAFMQPDLSESDYLGSLAISQLESKINQQSSKTE